MTVQQALESAIAHHQAGRLAEAETLYRKVLATDPHNPDALHLLGMVALASDQPQAAVDLIGRAIAINPQASVYHVNLGSALRAAGQLDLALVAMRRAMAMGLPPGPPLIDGTIAYAHALRAKGEFDAAAEAFRTVTEMAPERAEIWAELGICLQKAGRRPEADEVYSRALSLDPDNVISLSNLSCIRREAGELEASLQLCEKALSISQDHGETWNNLGATLYDLHRAADSIPAFDRASELSAEIAPQALLNRAMSVLATGNLREGFAEYEKRTPLLPTSKHQNMAPRWDGAPLDGSTIMLWAEQGFGDTIQFARYAKLVAERGGRVLISVQKPLIELFRTCSGVAGIMMHDDLPNLRAQYPLLGLPHLLGTNTLEDIPADVPYLNAETGRIETWRERIGESKGKLRVGLAWAADPKGGSAQRKSCPPELLAPLLDINGAQFISLQKTRDPSVGDLPQVIDLTAQLEDFADTAALVHHLDLVISIDTAVCHLAGAMGKPVWTLLPYSPDWRWLFDRSDTPWYPTMRLFRQPAPLDWKSMIDSVAMELRERAKSRAS